MRKILIAVALVVLMLFMVFALTGEGAPLESSTVPEVSAIEAAIQSGAGAACIPGIALVIVQGDQNLFVAQQRSA